MLSKIHPETFGHSQLGNTDTNAADERSHVRRLDSAQLLAIFECGVRERLVVDGCWKGGRRKTHEGIRSAGAGGPFSFENQMATLRGGGNSGRVAIIEGRVDQHEQSFQRAKGFTVATEAVFTLVQFVLELLHRK
jgi:hypothetical protein